MGRRHLIQSRGPCRRRLPSWGPPVPVTGSRYLVDSDGRRVLVDCGMFQGLKELRLRNWADPPVPPASIDAVVLTHAHLDHVGMLPRLVAQGFNGRIFCTPGTQDLCSLVLPDAGRLQEEEAERANRGGYSRHRPARPLFTEEQAVVTLSRLQPVGYQRPIPVIRGLEVEFVPTGHLLGAAYVRMRRTDRPGGTVIFGGDLGRYDRPVLQDPSPGSAADVLLVESTYGDRLHPVEGEDDALAAIINETAQRGGKVIIPAFAIGRVEEVLYAIKRLEDAKAVRALPVYRRQSDGARGAEVLPAPCGRAGCGHRRGHGYPARRTVRILHSAFHTCRDGAGVPCRRRAAGPGDRGVVQRHGHRRPGSAPPGQGVARCAEHRAARRVPGRGYPRPAADRRCPGSADLRAVGSRAGPRRRN